MKLADFSGSMILIFVIAELSRRPILSGFGLGIGFAWAPSQNLPLRCYFVSRRHVTPVNHIAPEASTETPVPHRLAISAELLGLDLFRSD